MFEGNFFGMQMKTACLFYAVERVAEDRGIQAFVMGTMHTQLVGSACFRIESQTEMGGIDAFQNLIFRDGFLALLMMNYL